MRLNAAIGASRNGIIARVDGHAMLPEDYLQIAVETLEETGADNVGGVMAAEGVTPFEQAVARAMTSKIGVGGARFHTGGTAGPADTVYLGVFRREALERVGGYDEHFQRAQDWEMNHRIRETGGLVWFQPRMRVSYRPRPSVKALAKQYFHYGRWRQGRRPHPRGHDQPALSRAPRGGAGHARRSARLSVLLARPADPRRLRGGDPGRLRGDRAAACPPPRSCGCRWCTPPCTCRGAGAS